MSAPKNQNAYVPHDLKSPIKGARSGVLSGITVAIKDMYDIAGERVSGGSPAWLEAHAPATENAAVVDRVLAAGATIVGKTICDEFFYSITGGNAHYGTPLNPRAPSRIPGGSSSGSASAASSGSCDIAIGSDTGGSVRVPSSLCGVYGIRVSRRRMDLRGAMSMAPSFDAGGWMASSPGPFVRAAEALLENYNPLDDRIDGVSLLTDALAISDPRIAEATRDFVRSVGQHLPLVSNAVAAGEKFDKWREAFRIAQAYEVWQTFGEFIERSAPSLGPGVEERMRIAAAIKKDDVDKIRPVLQEVTSRMEELTANRTVLVLPTVPVHAPALAAAAEELESYRVNTMRLVCLASISGLPQITIPVGVIDNSPIGVSFLGWRGGEEALLRLAERLSSKIGKIF